MATRSPRLPGAREDDGGTPSGDVDRRTESRPGGAIDRARASSPARAPRVARTLRRLAVALALLATPGAALAAVTIKGKVVGTGKLLNPVWNEAKDPKANRYTFREPSATVRSDVRTLVGYMPKELCIAALGDKGVPLKTPLRVVVAGGRTSPVTVVVAEGQTIQFENGDPFPHKLYDVGNKGLQPGETPAGKSRTWTPPGPGKYEIRDQLAPSIRSWIVVEPKAAGIGYPDSTGAFAIDLEPGAYKLQSYFSGEPVGKPLDVTVAPLPAEQLIREPVSAGDTSDAGAGK